MSTQARDIVGIHRDRHGWWERYVTYCEKYGLQNKVIDLFSDEWREHVRECRVVLFRSTMYPENIRILKERVYFMDRVLGIHTVPNLNSFWCFDSKAIERDILSEFGMAIPRTLVVTTPHDIQRLETLFAGEIVMKEPAGAGSARVRKQRNTKAFRTRLRLWQLDSAYYRIANVVLRRIGLYPVSSPQKVVQEVIQNDGYDLRVVTLGQRYAYIFKRMVRPGDFRASASGLIDYTWHGSYEAIIKGCVEFSRRLHFNTMAYDVLVDKQGRWYVSEMSCQYTGKALLDCPNVFRVDDDLQELERLEPIDPLELNVRSLIEEGVVSTA